MLSRFFKAVIDSQGTLRLAFGLFGTHLAAAIKFSYSSFGVCFLDVS